jgi:hypothetical protein
MQELKGLGGYNVQEQISMRMRFWLLHNETSVHSLETKFEMPDLLPIITRP